MARDVKKGKRRLKSMDHVRVLLADTLRALEAASSLDDPETAKIVISGAKVLGDLVRGSKLEERLESMEHAIAQLGVSALHNQTAMGGTAEQDLLRKLDEASIMVPVPIIPGNV